jgi:hypothetical protein
VANIQKEFEIQNKKRLHNEYHKLTQVLITKEFKELSLNRQKAIAHKKKKDVRKMGLTHTD